MKNNKNTKSASITAIGLLFITLGITLKATTSWLFILAGGLFLLQVFYDTIKSDKK